MNKLLAALIVAAFATTGAFAQAPAKKDEAVQNRRIGHGLGGNL